VTANDMFAGWQRFSSKPCPQCDQPLIGGMPQPLVFENGVWTHGVCLLRAKRALAGATKLATIAYAMTAYEKIEEDAMSIQFGDSVNSKPCGLCGKVIGDQSSRFWHDMPCHESCVDTDNDQLHTATAEIAERRAALMTVRFNLDRIQPQS
jgi:hypothetical protein